MAPLLRSFREKWSLCPHTNSQSTEFTHSSLFKCHRHVAGDVFSIVVKDITSSINLTRQPSGKRQGHALDKSPTPHQASNTETKTPFAPTFTTEVRLEPPGHLSSNCMSLGCGRKLEDLKRIWTCYFPSLRRQRYNKQVLMCEVVKTCTRQQLFSLSPHACTHAAHGHVGWDQLFSSLLSYQPNCFVDWASVWRWETVRRCGCLQIATAKTERPMPITAAHYAKWKTCRLGWMFTNTWKCQRCEVHVWFVLQQTAWSNWVLV